MIITIDGPTASGKSSTGRRLAKKLGYYFVNSGMLYRAAAYLLVHKKGYEFAQLSHVRLEDIQECFDPERLTYQYDYRTKEHVFYDHIDITHLLKNPVIDQGASMCSTDLRVREEVNKFLRHLGQTLNLVVDGRDAGTVVFPQADMKFFLTAPLAVRAERWIYAQKKLGNFYNPAQAVQFIVDRDERDRNREVAPMIIPDDACIIDNSKMNISQTLTHMLILIKQKFGEKFDFIRMKTYLRK